jgi:hypothetical protein
MNSSQSTKHVRLTSPVMEPSNEPLMQVVLMKIDGVEYELFGPIISDNGRDLGNLEEVTFSETVPLPAVIAYLTTLLIGSNLDARKKMQ